MARGYEKPPIWATALIVVCVVGLAVGLPVALNRSGPAAEVSVQGSTPTLTTAEPEAPVVEEAPSLSAVPPGSSVLFFGDSFTDGQGADSPEGGFAPLTADALGWDGRIEGGRGTGYTTPGPNGEGTYADRLTDLEADPALPLIVLQGGQNDLGAGEDAIRRGFRDTFNGLRELFPAAAFVVVGPMIPLGESGVEVSDTLQAIADSEGLAYVSPVGEGWITEESATTLVSGGHPTPAGHELLAQRLADDLRALGVQ